MAAGDFVEWRARHERSLLVVTSGWEAARAVFAKRLHESQRFE